MSKRTNRVLKTWERQDRKQRHTRPIKRAASWAWQMCQDWWIPALVLTLLGIAILARYMRA